MPRDENLSSLSPLTDLCSLSPLRFILLLQSCQGTIKVDVLGIAILEHFSKSFADIIRSEAFLPNQHNAALPLPSVATFLYLFHRSDAMDLTPVK